MRSLRYLPFLLLSVALGAFSLVTDRVLVREERRAREESATKEREEARLVALSVRAALAQIEQDLLADRALPGVTLERTSVAPETPIGRGWPAVPYGRRSRQDLVRLLASTDSTTQGLPEAVAAALALGAPERQPEVIERLLAGLLPVRPEDLPYLARVLGIEEDPRVLDLARRLDSAPDAARLPFAPSFERRFTERHVLEGWSRWGRVRLHYEIEAASLLERAGVAGRAQLQKTAENESTIVPDVTSLAVLVVNEGARPARILPLRALLWLTVVASILALLLILAAQRREAHALGRERAFISGVTHELRTPLTAIRVFGETLAEGRGDPREYGALIARESERLGSLVEGVLAAARADEAPRFSRVSPEEIVRSALRFIAPRAEDRSVTLECNVEDGLQDVVWDGDAVERALLNLLDNAVKHGRHGGRVHVRARSAGGDVLLEVSDDGPGIGFRERAGLFGRFTRGSTDAPGTGLGLHLVERVARAHGGRLDLETEENRGCTFTLTLPRAPRGAP